MFQIESMKTTSMEPIGTGVLDKNKEHYSKSKDKAEKSYDVFRHIQLHMSKYKKNKITGGKWLIHDTKRRKDNQLQSLKLPWRVSKLTFKQLAVYMLHVYGYDALVHPYPFWDRGAVRIPLDGVGKVVKNYWQVWVAHALWAEYPVLVRLV